MIYIVIYIVTDMKTMLSVSAEPVCGLLSVNEDTYLIQKCQVMHITDWSFSTGGDAWS